MPASRQSAPRDRERIVTPDTDPARFTAKEAAYFRRGRCGRVAESGNGRGNGYCGERSKKGASFGHCEEHDAEMLLDSFPDGSSRFDADPDYQKRPDYRKREKEWLRIHRRNCRDRDCECRGR